MFFVLPEAFIFVGVLQNCFVTTETFLVLVFSFLYTTRTVFSSILFLCSHLGYYWQLFVHQTHYIQTLRAEFKLNWNLVKRWRIHTENWEIRQRPWCIMFTGGRAVHSDDTWAPVSPVLQLHFLGFPIFIPHLLLKCRASYSLLSCVCWGVVLWQQRGKTRVKPTTTKNTKKGSQVRQIKANNLLFLFLFFVLLLLRGGEGISQGCKY